MIFTGYYGRASENGHRAISTKVHVVENGKPICGYKPHATMSFQWCSHGINRKFIKRECVGCNRVVNRLDGKNA